MSLMFKLGRSAPRLAHRFSPGNSRALSTTPIHHDESSSIKNSPFQRPPLLPIANLPTKKSPKKKSFTKNESQPKVIFSGIQPTGVPHLGNYLGALKQWKDMQDSSHHSDTLFFSIVDLHALTIPGNADKLRRDRREMLTSLLAIGLNPERSTIFYQSSVPQHAELQWILSCTASTGYLSRMTQWKSKLSTLTTQSSPPSQQPDPTISSPALKHGLFSYPILQAADILLHRATHVPVGSDQKQHLEFARECVTNFHSSWSLTAPHSRIFPSPRTISLDTSSRVMSLQDPTKKMSKSDPNPKSKIFINDDEATIRKKINAALTDSVSTTVGRIDPVNRPGVANLLEILGGFSGKTGQEVADEISGDSLAQLKMLTADAVIAGLAEVRDRFILFGEDTEANRKRVKEIEDVGTNNALMSAMKTMKMVKEAIGLS
ncbi:putative mitochondrial tryptophanyl-tRNA synthetase [Cercophora samala]|uniref:tryptophan--tRNA ligase n=1 Tax=Cercophora samala TaxID=330535 RepID=A0AA40DA14_9PEZI|nr:putative mitochondrial tryptophanyl-tRNA synthetase [Cercophora samala]